MYTIKNSIRKAGYFVMTEIEKVKSAYVIKNSIRKVGYFVITEVKVGELAHTIKNSIRKVRYVVGTGIQRAKYVEIYEAVVWQVGQIVP